MLMLMLLLLLLMCGLMDKHLGLLEPLLVLLSVLLVVAVGATAPAAPAVTTLPLRFMLMFPLPRPVRPGLSVFGERGTSGETECGVSMFC